MSFEEMEVLGAGIRELDLHLERLEAWACGFDECFDAGEVKRGLSGGRGFDARLCLEMVPSGAWRRSENTLVDVVFCLDKRRSCWYQPALSKSSGKEFWIDRKRVLDVTYGFVADLRAIRSEEVAQGLTGVYQEEVIAGRDVGEDLDQ